MLEAVSVHSAAMNKDADQGSVAETCATLCRWNPRPRGGQGWPLPRPLLGVQTLSSPCVLRALCTSAP